MAVNLVTAEELKPFPLPQYLLVLPEIVLTEFSRLYDLVQGYIKSLPQFKQHFRVNVINELNVQVSQLNQCIDLLIQYNEISEKIKTRVDEVNGIYGEWINLETIQYQLLSSNFNQEVLKKRFEKLIAESEVKLVAEIKTFKNSGQSEADFNEFVENFRRERKVYHLRKEKFNRWNEERVTGFI